jgi:hypothetical protein
LEERNNKLNYKLETELLEKAILESVKENILYKKAKITV